MAYFIQQTINGLTLGSIYGLVALGYTMVYGIVGMINFAHGEIYMIGAFISIMAFTAHWGCIGITWAPLAIVAGAADLPSSSPPPSAGRSSVIAYRPLRGSLSPGAADLGHRHVDLPAELRAIAGRERGLRTPSSRLSSPAAIRGDGADGGFQRATYPLIQIIIDRR